jgi:hypothetical protein
MRRDFQRQGHYSFYAMRAECLNQEAERAVRFFAVLAPCPAFGFRCAAVDLGLDAALRGTFLDLFAELPSFAAAAPMSVPTIPPTTAPIGPATSAPAIAPVAPPATFFGMCRFGSVFTALPAGVFPFVPLSGAFSSLLFFILLIF